MAQSHGGYQYANTSWEYPNYFLVVGVLLLHEYLEGSSYQIPGLRQPLLSR